MPIVTIQLARRAKPVTRTQKKALAQGITQLLVDTLGKKPETVTVLLQELPADNWAEGGELVSELRKHRA
jgi:4-oxalocrotonate tautomerase